MNILGNIRRRSTAFSGDKSDWESGGGSFYDYQLKLKNKFPDIRFENECCDPDTKLTECSITGFQGTPRDLLNHETTNVTFFIEDGRVVVRYDPSMTKIKVKITNDQLVFIVWISSFVAIVLYILANRERFF